MVILITSVTQQHRDGHNTSLASVVSVPVLLCHVRKCCDNMMGQRVDTVYDYTVLSVRIAHVVISPSSVSSAPIGRACAV